MKASTRSKIDILMLILLIIALYDISTLNGTHVKQIITDTKDKVGVITKDIQNVTSGIINAPPNPNTSILNSTPEPLPKDPPSTAPSAPTGGSSEIPDIGPIINIQTCNTEPAKDGCPSVNEFHVNDTVYVYWQVNNSVGCCGSYGCNFELFNKTCLSNNWRFLYVPYLNKEIMELEPGTYTCEHITPWNYVSFPAEEKKTYILEIYQRDCTPRVLGYFKKEIEVT